MKKVMLDPGHGGYDPGAVGPSGVQEKNITLAVALQVADFLASAAEVRLTHKEDVPWDDNSDLAARSAMTNEWSADCFVSIHCNSASGPEAHGTETFHYPGSEQGQALANSLQARLINALGLTDRGVKEANFAVLRQTNCPACLAELAFVSNPAEEALLVSPDFQAKAARAIAEGVVDFLGLSLPDYSQQDSIAKAIDVLQEADILNDPNYWLENARPGKQADGEYVGILIQRMAKKLKGV